MHKKINYESLMKENQEHGIIWEKGCGRDAKRKNKTIKHQTKNWSQEELLKLIRVILLTTERENVTRELFSFELKAKQKLVNNCFQELTREGVLLKDNYILHDEYTSTTKHKRSGSWWNAKIYKIRRKNEKI